MAGVSGKAGNVAWAGKLPSGAPIRAWSADITVDTFDVTTMASTAPVGHERVCGLQDCKGTISFVHSDSAIGVLPGGAAVTLTLTATTGATYAFDAILTGIHPSCVVDGECLLTYDFELCDTDGVTAAYA